MQWIGAELAILRARVPPLPLPPAHAAAGAAPAPRARALRNGSKDSGAPAADVQPVAFAVVFARAAPPLPRPRASAPPPRAALAR